MKRILFINGHMNTGGVEKSLLDILRHMDYSQYQVDLLLLEEIGEYEDQIPPEVNVHLKSLKNTYGPCLKSLRACVKARDWFGFQMRIIMVLMKFLGQRRISLARRLLTGTRRYDCAIGFRPGICTQIAAFAVDAAVKATWWHHGEINVEHRRYLECAEACDKIVSVSDGCLELLSRTFPSIAEKLSVVPNMIDAQLIMRKADEFFPYDRHDVTQIATICRLSPEKHIENAIYTAKALKKAGCSFQWHLIGGGGIEVQLREAAEAAGVADVLYFEGSQPNPYPYLKNADLFVHPSYVESQGIVILEAMALGVPCVVTKSLGPCEFIEDGVNGILTEQSPESLAEKVLEILRDRRLYEHVRANTHCPEKFMPDCVMKQIRDLLEKP